MQKKIVSLGFFDGVHLGHGALLKKTKELAESKNLISSALLFDRHPAGVVSGASVPLINTADERALLMKHFYGIDEMLPIEFNTSCASLPWDKFVKSILIDRFNACHFVVGFDFRFGYKGEGDGEKLAALCNRLNIACDIVNRVELDEKTISSSLIRSFIEQGDMKSATKFLGHNHFMLAPVEHGAALGRSIGIPTINQRFAENACIPLFGVYATRVHIDGKVYYGVTNVGIRPSVKSDNIPRAETYIIDFSGDLYGKKIAIEFIDMLRKEQKFESLDALKHAIESDIKKSLEILK